MRGMRGTRRMHVVNTCPCEAFFECVSMFCEIHKMYFWETHTVHNFFFLGYTPDTHLMHTHSTADCRLRLTDERKKLHPGHSRERDTL